MSSQLQKPIKKLDVGVLQNEFEMLQGNWDLTTTCIAFGFVICHPPEPTVRSRHFGKSKPVVQCGTKAPTKSHGYFRRRPKRSISLFTKVDIGVPLAAPGVAPEGTAARWDEGWTIVI